MRWWFYLLALLLAWAGLEGVLQLGGLAARFVYRPQLAHPGAPTILCLGDSHTFGVGVPADRTYPAQLEQLLADRGLTVNVVNLGAPGTNTSQIRCHLPEWIQRFRPSAIVVLAGVNDGWNSSEVLRVEWEDGMLKSRPGQLWRARLLNILSHLKSYRLAVYLFRHTERDRREVEQARDREGRSVLHDYNPQGASADPYADAKRAFRNLCRMAETARNQQVSLILMTYVGVPAVTFETVNDVLRQAARSCSMPLVDNDQILHPLLVDQAGLVNTDLRNALFFPDMHPTAQGYQRIADNLARFLIEQHLLPRAEAKSDKP